MIGNTGIPFVGFTPEERNRYQVIVCTIEDTLTQNEKLHPNVLKALWDLKKSGRTTILLTSGAIGFSDACLRLLPVDAVIAENGATMICRSRNGEVLHVPNPSVSKDDAAKKRGELLKMTSGLQFSSDQPVRVFGVAYDKRKMSSLEMKVLKNTAIAMGATYLEDSSVIHIWFGNYNRKKAIQQFLQGPLEMKEDFYLEHSLFLSASSLDSDLFGYFPTSIGMKNLGEKKEVSILPAYLSERSFGEGFCEVVKALIGL